MPGEVVEQLLFGVDKGSALAAPADGDEFDLGSQNELVREVLHDPRNAAHPIVGSGNVNKVMDQHQCALSPYSERGPGAAAALLTSSKR
jgi:hypothetical protein